MISILMDITQCVGCSECVQGCVQANQLKDEIPMQQDTGDGLSAERWCAVLPVPGVNETGRFMRKVCQHCLEPACVSVCPASAMIKTPEGPVIYDADKCMGCRYCMMACPYGIPRYEWDSPAPLVKKCTLCYERTNQGQMPACVEACEHDALIFGQRDELLQFAHQKISAHPDQYLDHIYGEHEFGGTSVLYISDVPIDAMGFNGHLREQAMPELTWAWLDKVPTLSLVTAGLMTGIFAVVGKRMQAEENRQNKKNSGQSNTAEEA